MPEDMDFDEQGAPRLEGTLGAGLAGPALAGAVLFPFVAFGERQAAAHDHGASSASVQAELAQVRAGHRQVPPGR